MTDPTLNGTARDRARTPAVGPERLRDTRGSPHRVTVNDASGATKARAARPESRFAFSDLGEALTSVGKTRQWRITGFVEGTPIVVWVASEKAMKSWVAMYTAVCLATGSPWFGAYAVEEPGTVVYVDCEYGEHEFARRLARIARGIGHRPEDVIPLIRHFSSYELALDTQNEAAKWLAKQCKDIAPALIVLDPWRNVLPGEENNADDVKTAMGVAAQIRDMSGAPVWIPHHLNRAGTFNGSRALLGRADLIVEGSDEAEPWYSARGRTIRRDDPIARKFTIALTHDDDTDDSIAATRFALRFEGEAVAKAQLGKTALRVLALLRKADRPMTKNAIRVATDLNSPVVTRVLCELRDAAQAEERDGKWSLATPRFFDDLRGAK
jgi:hypothetical protein